MTTGRVQPVMVPVLTAERSIAAAGALDAAGETGVLDALAESPHTATEVADRCGLDRDLVTLLLDALCAVGAVMRDDGTRYSARIDASRVEHAHQLWQFLPKALREGGTAFDVSDTAVAATGYPKVAEHIASIAEPLRPEVTRALAGTGPRVLDLAAGNAPWTRALAATDPRLRVTAVVLPDGLAVTERVVEADGLGGRFDFIAGSIFDVDLGGPYDLILLAAVCRLFGPERNAHLLARAARSLDRGGTIAILDAIPDVDRADGQSNALYALNLALRTSEGGIHSFSSYANWLYAAGLTGIELNVLSLPELSLIRATRPA